MALSFKPVMVEDNGSRRTAEQEAERKKKQEQQQAMAADPRANVQMAYSTPSGQSTTPAAAKTPYEQRKAEIKAGVNKAQPISYAAPAAKKAEEPEEETPKPNAGNGMTAPAHKQYKSSTVDEELATLQKDNPDQYGGFKAPAESKTAAPQTVAEATETETTKPRRSGENRAEANTEAITYTGGDIARKTTGTGTAAQTKAAMTEDEERRWYEENGLSWAAPTTGTGTVSNGLADAERQKAQQRANAYAASKRAGYEADQTAIDNAAAYNAGRKRALEVAEGIGIFGQEAEEYADRLMAAGVIAPQNVSQATQQQSIWDKINSGINASTAQQQARTDQVLNTYGNRNTQGAANNQQAAQEWANAYAASKRAGYDYTPAASQAAIEAANAYAASKRAGYEYTPPEEPKTIIDRINEGIASSTEQQAPRTDQILQTYANRNTQGAQTDQQKAQQWANAYAASKRAGYEYTPPVNRIDTASRTEADYGTTPERARALEVAQSMGLFGPEAVEFADRIVSSGTYNFKPNEAQIETKAENDYLDRMYSNEQWQGMTDEQKNAAKENAQTNAEAVLANYRVGTPGGQRFDALQGTDKQQETSASNESQSNNKTTNPNRPGAAAEVASWEQNQGWVSTNNKEGVVIDESTKPKVGNKSGTTTTDALGNQKTDSSKTTGTTSDKNPKGTQYLTPSYGQGGKVVKLPYKSGGYTEAELMALGNKAYGTKYGSNVYEGYYKAPDGNYYPVDQEKAAYYLKNGYSYEGWEEPMRDYYKTFGTFYGYRPDWKTAGKSTGGGYSYSPRSYSYSSGGSSNARFGRGTTANNGLYWNGLASWSA